MENARGIPPALYPVCGSSSPGGGVPPSWFWLGGRGPDWVTSPSRKGHTAAKTVPSPSMGCGWQNLLVIIVLLPHTSKGWGRYCFHRCVSVNRGRGVPLLTGPWSQVLSWGQGVPQSGPRTGVPPPPSQDHVPPTPTHPQTGYGAGGMPLAFSRRRTFFLFTKTNEKLMSHINKFLYV